ncbi:hypothetical protein L1987_35141 [Smallanthus sonchifolius]|uniref:Uncharacterized protein n=1 Tax=Smallanthus sonchifolius TaxID=185202 RepID=A0ACB9HVJ3_9ASTR|nr:hypothetical protein L1987_35141 [Smallanthus sonchifolius]
MAQIQEPERLKIPLQDIKLATNNFSEDNFIGKGGFGRVYKGLLPPSTSSGEPITSTVAVKSFGYAHPQFQKTGALSKESDVYSFGVVLLWGSSTGGSPWSLLLDNNLKLRKITIDHEDWIFSIGFTVEDLSGSLISSQHGGTGGPSGGELSEVIGIVLLSMHFG